MKKVEVIGCGVIGLTTGVSLLKAGVKDVTIITKYMPTLGQPKLASEVACALWGPIWTSETRETKYQKKESQWCECSFNRFDEIHEAERDAGVTRVVHEEYFERGQNFLSPEAFPYLSISEEPVSHEFRKQTYETFVVAMPFYLRWLASKFLELGGRLLAGEEITGRYFEETSAQVVVNCTGLGAGNLFPDGDLVGVKGQLLFFPPNPAVDRSIGYGEFCVIPRPDALVLGSLYLRSFDTERPLAIDSERIIQGTKRFLPAETFNSPPLMTLAALRPVRMVGVRLEVDRTIGGPAVIVHNYGHGGAGVTLSWGCAEEVVRLIVEKGIKA